MRGESLEIMAPWWRGFKGSMTKVDDQRWRATGLVHKLDSTTVEITELPLNRWTQTFKKELEAMIGEKGEGGVKVNCLTAVSSVLIPVLRIIKNITTA